MYDQRETLSLELNCKRSTRSISLKGMGKALLSCPTATNSLHIIPFGCQILVIEKMPLNILK